MILYSGRMTSTHCSQDSFQFPDLGARKVVVDFSGGTLSSDGGAPLLRQVDASLSLTRSLAACFRDGRNQRFIEHALPELLAQRIHGLALGYEDINDHNQLRRDPVFATACGKLDPLGQDRSDPAHRGCPLSSAATLNRLELSNNKTTRAHKLRHDPAKVAACLLTIGVRCLPKHTKEVVLDLDSMGHLLHGSQEGRHYNDYDGEYCYLPLYLVVGDVVLWAQLRLAEKFVNQRDDLGRRLGKQIVIDDEDIARLGTIKRLFQRAVGKTHKTITAGERLDAVIDGVALGRVVEEARRLEGVFAD